MGGCVLSWSLSGFVYILRRINALVSGLAPGRRHKPSPRIAGDLFAYSHVRVWYALESPLRSISCPYEHARPPRGRLRPCGPVRPVTRPSTRTQNRHRPCIASQARSGGQPRSPKSLTSLARHFTLPPQSARRARSLKMESAAARMVTCPRTPACDRVGRLGGARRGGVTQGGRWRRYVLPETP